MEKALVLLSGGLDSTVVLAHCIDKFGKDNVGTIRVTYGQRHVKELVAAQDIVEHYSIPDSMNFVVDASSVFQGMKCALLGKDGTIPEGTYTSQGDHPATEVPFRNGVFLSIAASVAMANGFSYVYCGIHADDARAAYADTSESFFDGMRIAVNRGTDDKVYLRAPFVSKSKEDIVKRGSELGVPFEKTWSCYEGGDKPCGKCGTCIQRADAFAQAGIKDPLIQEE